MVPGPVPPLLALRGITKRFGGVTALEGVDFTLRSGEIHALLGENGAGKSTLIKILAGVHAPDAGEICVSGVSVRLRHVADADRHGIRVIHQELSLAPNLTIAENIFLGREPSRWGWLQREGMAAAARQVVQRLSMHELLPVDRVVSSLSVAHQQLVEIARALSCDAQILVLDEPTSALSEAETDGLFRTLERLRASGVGLIYISHRLDEIRRLADRATVLRDGQYIGTQSRADWNERQLVQWMVGRDVQSYFHRPAFRPGAVALEVSGLESDGVAGVSFALHAGEILGLAGLVGAGRSALARTLFGLTPQRGGTISVCGQPVQFAQPEEALAAGLVMVPEDRRREGLFLVQSTAFNLALPWARQWNRGIVRDAARHADIVQRALDRFAIKAADPDQPVGLLSGGNQQKVMIGRWMEQPPRVLVLDEPTRGIDVGAREELFRLISLWVEQGMAVLLISSDLIEVLKMSHRVALYRDGGIMRIAPAEELTLEQVVSELTGAHA